MFEVLLILLECVATAGDLAGVVELTFLIDKLVVGYRWLAAFFGVRREGQICRHDWPERLSLKYDCSARVLSSGQIIAKVWHLF